MPKKNASRQELRKTTRVHGGKDGTATAYRKFKKQMRKESDRLNFRGFDKSRPELLELRRETPDGRIDVDSRLGKQIGFTSDRFQSVSYLWKYGDYVMLSFVWTEVEGQGYIRDLVNAIHQASLGVKVPTPLGRMAEIVQKNGYQRVMEKTEIGESVEVWVLEPGVTDA
jgi:hypothetical protein